MHLNKKIASILSSTLLIFSMVGCQQQEKNKTDNEQKIELETEEHSDISNTEILEYEYTLQMELFDQVFDIMINCSNIGSEQSKEQLSFIQEHKTTPTNKFIQNYDKLLDKLIFIAVLYVGADESEKEELLVFIEDLLQEKSQLDREFEKIMEGAQEI